MSRLYVWVRNEKNQEKTLQAQECYDIQVNYGSKKSSKLAVRVHVYYGKDSLVPTVEVVKPKDVKVFEKDYIEY